MKANNNALPRGVAWKDTDISELVLCDGCTKNKVQ